MKRSFGANGLSDVDGPYNSTDVVGDGVPQRRFARAYRLHDFWIIWFEQGGRATGVHTVAFTRWKDDAGRLGPYKAMANTMLQGNLCAATRAIADGVLAVQQ